MSGACGPFVDGYIDHEFRLLPSEDETGIHYKDHNCLSARPRRERLREEIADFVLAMLGAPTLRIELDVQQIAIAIDYSLKRFESYAPRKLFQYFYFKTSPGQSRYKMPCDIGIIRNVYFSNGGSCASGLDYLGDGSVMPWSGGILPGMGGIGTGLGGAGSGGTFGMPGYGSLGDWQIFQGYQELFRRILSGEPTWEFAPDNVILLFPNPRREMNVAVEYLQRKNDWDDVGDWVKKYALSLCKEQLGRIRSKFDRFVTPSGGVSLDGASLLQEAFAEREKLDQLLIDKYSTDHMLPMWG